MMSIFNIAFLMKLRVVCHGMLTDRRNKVIVFIMACFLSVFGFAGQSAGIAGITNAILATTGISRNVFSMIYMISMLVGGCLVLFGGSIVDRIGVRRSAIYVLVLWTTVLSFMACSFVLFRNIFSGFVDQQSYFIVVLFIGLSALRFLGKNMMPLIGRMQAVSTFDTNKGIAVAVSGICVSIMTGLAPSVMYGLSGGSQWQVSYGVLSVVSVVAVLLFIRYFYPINCGKKHHADNSTTSISENFGKVFSRRYLLCQLKFWCVASVIIMNSFIGGGLAVHIVDIFAEKGVACEVAIRSYFYLSVATIISHMVFGRIFDKRGVKNCIIIMLCLQFFGLTGLDNVNYFCGLALYVICIGATWGAYNALLTAAWHKLFGAQNMGTILGLVCFMSTIVSSFSVPLMSFSKSIFGSYFVLMRCIMIVIACLIMFTVWRFPSDIKKC